MGMEQKLAHLRMIRVVISRIARNPFLIKGGSVSLVAALFALHPASTVVQVAPREVELHGHVANGADDQSVPARGLLLGESRRPTTPGVRPVTEPVRRLTRATYSSGWRLLGATGTAPSHRPIQTKTANLRSRRNG